MAMKVLLESITGSTILGCASIGTALLYSYNLSRKEEPCKAPLIGFLVVLGLDPPPPFFGTFYATTIACGFAVDLISPVNPPPDDLYKKYKTSLGRRLGDLHPALGFLTPVFDFVQISTTCVLALGCYILYPVGKALSVPFRVFFGCILQVLDILTHGHPLGR